MSLGCNMYDKFREKASGYVMLSIYEDDETQKFNYLKSACEYYLLTLKYAKSSEDKTYIRGLLTIYLDQAEALKQTINKFLS